MDKSIVLLSGGMDSATALLWAKENTEIVATLFFDYGQHGAPHEYIAACSVFSFAFGGLDDPPEVMRIGIQMPCVNWSALTHTSPFAGLEPGRVDEYGMPSTFVPGRNLVFIAYATSLAYTMEADLIVGGWNALDVDYPDCQPDFLRDVSAAASRAIGRDVMPSTVPGGYAYGLKTVSPVLLLTKTETVELGTRLGVPWDLTRSCYAAGPDPCLTCDSCIKRVNAFIQAEVRDPLVAHTDMEWDTFVEEWEAGCECRCAPCK